MSAKPWFAWYPADYRSKTSHLTFVEDSAYRKLLDAYYDRGRPIEFDRGGLFRITGAMSPEEQAAVLKVAAEFFVLKNNKLNHQRVDEELEKQGRIREQLSEAGKRGAAIAGRGRPKQFDRPSVRQYSQSQSQRSNTLAPSGAFLQFWSAYPRKKSKGQAEKAWKRVANGNIEAIMAGLHQAIKSTDWTKEGGKFIPHPATWLNAKGWLDEQPAQQKQPFPI